MRPLILGVLGLFAAAVFMPSWARAAIAPDMPAGAYVLDGRHTSVTFKISHLGFSHFTGRFDHTEGSYTYHPEAPTQSILDVTIDTNSIDTNDAELDEDLKGENWFDAIHYPQATFHATSIEQLGDNRVHIIGDFTLHGVTHTLVLDATLVGAGTMPLSKTKVMGFSAFATFSRSDYGITNLVPFVGDEITLQVETEFDKDN